MGSDKPTDVEIMSNVLEALGINANKLANQIGYKSTSSIYNIMDKKNPAKISMELAKAIVKMYPQTNMMYLTMGELPILLDRGQTIGQSNFLGNSKPTFESIPAILSDIRDGQKELLEILKEIVSNSK